MNAVGAAGEAPTDSTETLASRADKRYRLARAVKKPVKHVSTARKGMAEPPVSAVSAACDTLLVHVGGMDKAAVRELRGGAQLLARRGVHGRACLRPASVCRALGGGDRSSVN